MNPGPPTPVLANDFALAWDDFGADALAALDRVGRSGHFVLGAEVAGFERELGAWWGARHVVGVASGLDALEICLRLAGVQPGDRVLTTPLTAYATTLAIIRAGAVPVFSDVDASGGLDLDQADAVLHSTPGITAILPVHLYGHPLDPHALSDLGARHGVPIIEDCAQSAGAIRDGRPTGSVGLVAASSLYPTKNLGAMGDGGVVLTEDFDLAERARRLRNYGQAARYHHVEVGMNSRLDEVQAAILRTAMLPRLDRWIARRRAIAARYDAEFAGTSLRPIAATGGTSACHLYAVEATGGDSNAIIEVLEASGVSIGRHYPIVCPDMPASEGIGITVGGLEVARQLAAQEISLPIHPFLDDAEVDRVIDACTSAAGS